MATCRLTEWGEGVIRSYGMMPARHHRLLMQELEALSHREIDRLMVQMPPGSAKSTYASILFPAWWFTQHPRDSIIAAAHTAGLANYFGRRTRGVILEEANILGYGLAPSDRASSHWSTSTGGEYYATGVRGAMIGRRADVAIIDDPIKSQEEADSQLHRDHLWEWYRSGLSPRLKPSACIVLIMTRWHEDDLCGRLLAHHPDEWRCLRLPALAEDKDQLHRLPGEALWPDWEDTQALLRRRASVGERAWVSQFQQSPRPQTGTLFQVTKIGIVDALPPKSGEAVVRAWDLAATAATGDNDPDWTVGVKLMRDAFGKFTVLDVTRLRGRPRAIEESIVATARADGPAVTIGLPEDPGQAGKSQVAYLTAGLAGHHIRASRETGSKITRATPMASQVGAGNLALVKAAWNQAFLEELQDFPFGRKDDQVDALSRALGMLIGTGEPARTISMSHMAR